MGFHNLGYLCNLIKYYFIILKLHYYINQIWPAIRNNINISVAVSCQAIFKNNVTRSRISGILLIPINNDNMCHVPYGCIMEWLDLMLPSSEILQGQKDVHKALIFYSSILSEKFVAQNSVSLQKSKKVQDLLGLKKYSNQK